MLPESSIIYTKGMLIPCPGKELYLPDSGAILYSDGTVVFYENGMIHRKNKPAIYNHDNSSMWWYKTGLVHRFDDKAREFFPSLDMLYCLLNRSFGTLEAFEKAKHHLKKVDLL